jgi:hypothetical protein
MDQISSWICSNKGNDVARIKHHREVTVNNLDDIMTLLRKGESQKRKAATDMNARTSSRAHSIFIMHQKCHDSGKTINRKLFLAYLGGCEQVKKSQQHIKRQTRWRWLCQE